MKTLPQNPSKILVIRYDDVSNTILTVPFLRNLAAHYPDTPIDMLVEPASGEFLKHCPYIHDLIYFDSHSQMYTFDQKCDDTCQKTYWDYISLLKKRNYDMAFILNTNFSSAFITFMAGISFRIGFKTDYRGLLLTHKPPYDLVKNEATCFLDILRYIDIPVTDTHLESWTSEKEETSIATKLKDYQIEAKKLVMINAVTKDPNKLWPEANFAHTIEQLVNDFDTQVILTGAEEDKETYTRIIEKLNKELKHPLINLCGELSFIETIELIKQMTLVISVDSCILYLAASVNTPIISIFGPINDEKWAPVNQKLCEVVSRPMSCSPSGLHKECTKGLICMSTVSHRDVVAAAAKFLKNNHTIS